MILEINDLNLIILKRVKVMNWIEDVNTDPEYRTYRFLAQLQQIDDAIRRKEVYPWLNEIQSQINQLESLNAQVNQINISQSIEVPEELKAHLDILSFALTQLSDRKVSMLGIVDKLKENIRIEPFILESETKESGYILIELPQKKEVEVFTYWKRFIMETGILVTSYYFKRLLRIKTDLRVTIDRLAWYLIRSNHHVMVPSIHYLFLTEDFPREQTVLPVIDSLINKNN